MVSRSRLYAQLEALESELLEKLVPHLETAAAGKNDLVFCVRGLNPANGLKHKSDKTTEFLVNIGAQILVLKEKLGEPSQGSVAERVCWYCREWDSLDNTRRNSAPNLANQFLEEIRNN